MTKWPPKENAMSFEDLPKKPPATTLGEPLDLLSVAELEQRVQQLESEIERTKEAIQSKRASKNAADSFFRS
jgi:uncharacterized small protein (DUF1192 family)